MCSYYISLMCDVPEYSSIPGSGVRGTLMQSRVSLLVQYLCSGIVFLDLA